MKLSIKSKLFNLKLLGLLVVSGFLFFMVLSWNGVTTGEPGMNIYTTKQPGQTNKLERPYHGAPPLVPHNLEELGITRSGNDCLGCHSEGAEVEKGHIATKIPPSHYVNEYSGETRKAQVVGFRYNCLQCHVPQSQ